MITCRLDFPQGIKRQFKIVKMHYGRVHSFLMIGKFIRMAEAMQKSC